MDISLHNVTEIKVGKTEEKDTLGGFAYRMVRIKTSDGQEIELNLYGKEVKYLKIKAVSTVDLISELRD